MGLCEYLKKTAFFFFFGSVKARKGADKCLDLISVVILKSCGSEIKMHFISVG